MWFLKSRGNYVLIWRQEDVMKTLSIFTFLFFSFFTFIIHASDSRDELPTQKTKATKETKVERPETILVKKDQNGNITVYESKDVLEEGALSGAELEQLQFKKPPTNMNLAKVSQIPTGLEELNQDKPRQSWYYWGWGWGFYYPVYYYNYAYYPTYYYGWGGCSYYWYNRWWW